MFLPPIIESGILFHLKIPNLTLMLKKYRNRHFLSLVNTEYLFKRFKLKVIDTPLGKQYYKESNKVIFCMRINNIFVFFIAKSNLFYEVYLIKSIRKAKNIMYM